jgi:hypothetical protein
MHQSSRISSLHYWLGVRGICRYFHLMIAPSQDPMHTLKDQDAKSNISKLNWLLLAESCNISGGMLFTSRSNTL